MTTRAEAQRRFPLEPLAVDLGIVWNAPGPAAGRLRELADQIGVTQGYVRKLRETGLSERQADVFAIRAGTHPEAVWGSEWSNDGVELDDWEAAA